MERAMTKGQTGGQQGYQRQNFSVITDARTASSEEMSGRIKRYAITMAFRTACFISMIFVGGPMRWVLFACAVFLPYIAVVLANQAHVRAGGDRKPTVVEPITAKQLAAGPPEGEVISGDVVDGDDRFRRGDGAQGRDPGTDERVA